MAGTDGAGSDWQAVTYEGGHGAVYPDAAERRA